MPKHLPGLSTLALLITLGQAAQAFEFEENQLSFTDWLNKQSWKDGLKREFLAVANCSASNIGDNKFYSCKSGFVKQIDPRGVFICRLERVWILTHQSDDVIRFASFSNGTSELKIGGTSGCERQASPEAATTTTTPSNEKETDPGEENARESTEISPRYLARIFGWVAGATAGLSVGWLIGRKKRANKS
jgi:hypothetical protein